MEERRSTHLRDIYREQNLAGVCEVTEEAAEHMAQRLQVDMS